MQFKIPQDVQREDKIVGPLTLKQLLICMVGGGVAYGLYISLAKVYFVEVWLPPVLVITVITVGIAFIRINDVTFTHFLMLLMEYNFLPKKRFWQKTDGDPMLIVMNEPEQKKVEQKKVEGPKKSMKSLHEISKMLDQNV